MKRRALQRRYGRFESPHFVDQTTFGRNGNCMSAALASLLGLDICEVPYFMEPGDWQARINRWLAPRGLRLKHVMVNTSNFKGWPIGYHILTGFAPRGPHRRAAHAVVGKDGVMVHDPHPSRAGLTSVDGYAVLVSKT
jgi:hypothetical protein